MKTRSKKQKSKSSPKALLLAWLSDSALRNRQKLSPLHVAIMQNDTQSALTLIKKGADVNAQDAQGWTPLFQARLQRNYPVMQALLAANANTALQTTTGETIYTYPFSDSLLFTAIILNNTHELKEKLSIAPVTPKEIALSISMGRRACLKLLLETGPSLKTQDYLRQALDKEDFSSFTLLLKAGAMVNKTDDFQNSLLHTIVYEKKFQHKTEYLAALLPYVKNIDPLDSFHNTPLMLAIKRKHVTYVTMLLKKKPNLRQKNLYQESVLGLAKKNSIILPALEAKKTESIGFFQKSVPMPLVVGTLCAGVLGIVLWRMHMRQ